MNAFSYWLNPDRKVYVKLSLLLLLSYFFMGVSEGAFFFQNGTDTLINFLFTLFCVGTNWVLFKWQVRFWSKKKTIPFYALLRGSSMVLLLALYTIAINWVYIEVLWQEALSQTVFFPIVLPMAIVLFLTWVLGYDWLRQLGMDVSKEELIDVFTFELKKGRQTVFKTIEETLGFKVEHKLVFLLSREGEKLLIDRPLTELEAELKDQGFFRVNRQLLLHRNSIQSYRTINNERIEVCLMKAMDEDSCIVSRYKAPAFRRWITQ